VKPVIIISITGIVILVAIIINTNNDVTVNNQKIDEIIPVESLGKTVDDIFESIPVESFEETFDDITEIIPIKIEPEPEKPDTMKTTIKPIFSFYDCAKTYDERMDLIHPYYESMQMDKVPDEIHYKAYDLSMEYLKNRCAITIESWAHESNHESKIWDSPWRAESYMSQLILGEVEPKNDSDRKIIEQYFENIKVEKQLREMKGY